jgi:alpha-L-rhamnosidase/Glycosyl hydrolases family 2, sugar binding domain
MKLFKLRISACSSLAIIFTIISFIPVARSDILSEGFQSPPMVARPRVWWHWMNGNISKEGIKLDLEWMQRVHLGGFQNFDANLTTPLVVPKRLVYMTPEWKDAFKYATVLADQLGLEEAIAGSPGWSETGGPWVPPSQGMKKYVWSETNVEGGKPYLGVLNHPPTVTGPYQTIPAKDHAHVSETDSSVPQFYADVAVVAYKAPETDISFDTLNPVISSSGPLSEKIDTSGSAPLKITLLPLSDISDDSWIQHSFSKPQGIRSVKLFVRRFTRTDDEYYGIRTPRINLYSSNNGKDFNLVTEFESFDSPEITLSFPEVKAKYFRIVFRQEYSADKRKQITHASAKNPKTKIHPASKYYEVVDYSLIPGARINYFEKKAAFGMMEQGLYKYPTPTYTADDVIPKKSIIDLTGLMQKDGTLNWNVPAGKWTILRLGYSLIGKTNHPATEEATGLEVDKLNRTYVKNYMDGYLNSYEQTVGSDMMGKRGIKYVITDSWEAGAQNWTDDMIEKFKRLRGYDPVAWLPVFAGHVVESSDASDRFLWDFRKTISDLVADEHYGQVQASLKERGMGHYGESHEGGRALIADGMEVKKLNDIPMSAMWTPKYGTYKETFSYNADDRESASVAHIYGQNIAAAESMTAGSDAWAWSPATLKATADQEFLNGINRFVIHESAHQPVVGKSPGLTLGPYGQWFNRNETWAEQAGPWIDYLSRCSFLLQQGQFQADIIYYYGEDSNLTALFSKSAPPIPLGYGYDYINPDGLIHALHMENNRITTPSGMNYRVLCLDAFSKYMSLPVLRAIYKLVQQGAIVIGDKPVDDPSLADDQAEFKSLTHALFGNGMGQYKVGEGKVYAGQSIEKVLKQLAIVPDFNYTKSVPDSRIDYVHRKVADEDIYFIANRTGHGDVFNASFRVVGKSPELWHPETGDKEAVSFEIKEAVTQVPLKLEAWGSAFIVFQKTSHLKSVKLPQKTLQVLCKLTGPWEVQFENGRGAPESTELSELISWTESKDAGIKYYSGVGAYSKTFAVDPTWLNKSDELWIDLGDVKNIAEVQINGIQLNQVWHAPYRLQVTKYLKAGNNTIKIRVTNAWVNRLIGDEQPGAVKYTYADVKPYSANSPLLPSGLIGPVRLISHKAY